MAAKKKSVKAKTKKAKMPKKPKTGKRLGRPPGSKNRPKTPVAPTTPPVNEPIESEYLPSDDGFDEDDDVTGLY